MLEYPGKFKLDVPRVAFYGPMASGKTYSAQNIFPRYEKFSLAGPLKKTALEYYGVTGKSNEERQILQELADDLKKWDNDVFTKRLLIEVTRAYATGLRRPAVVDDLRFTHEARDLKEHGFTIVRVEVPDSVRMARIQEKYPDTDPSRFEHVSETDWKNIIPDFVISGDGDTDLVALRQKLWDAVNKG